jgi:hypothetical protein
MINAVTAIHNIISNTIWLFFLILGLWGGLRAFQKQGVDGNYLGAMVIGQGLYLFQGLLGAVLWASGLLGGVGRPFMHVLYGAFAAVFMPFVYLVWLKGDDTNRAQWVLCLTALFLFGIALRAIGTGA